MGRSRGWGGLGGKIDVAVCCWEEDGKGRIAEEGRDRLAFIRDIVADFWEINRGEPGHVTAGYICVDASHVL